MKSLTTLSLFGNSKLSGESLSVLQSLPALNRLCLWPSFNLVQEQEHATWHLRHLRGLERLEFLELDGGWIAEEESANLKGMKGCRSLRIRNSFDIRERLVLRDQGLQHLSELPALTSLQLDETFATDEGLSFLSKLEKLSNLKISGQFTDAGLEHLKKLKSLRLLRLSSPNITEEGVERFNKEQLRFQQIMRYKYHERRPPL